jgi:hypothetical protein
MLMLESAFCTHNTIAALWVAVFLVLLLCVVLVEIDLWLFPGADENVRDD